MIFNEIVSSIMATTNMNKIANDSDYYDFINSFPAMTKCKDARTLCTFHALDAKLALKEKLMKEWKDHSYQAREYQQDWA